ncbi:MAG: hypothetical protein AB7P02_12680 [Alphaproteobacteria bacterium]
MVPEGDAEAVRAWARAYVDSGGNATAACRALGYSAGAVHAATKRLLGRPDVQAAIVTATRDKADALAPAMLVVLSKLALSSEVRESVRKDAALGVLAHTNLRQLSSGPTQPAAPAGLTLVQIVQRDRAARLGMSQPVEIEGKSRDVSYAGHATRDGDRPLASRIDD